MHITRMVVQGQLVEPSVHFSVLYEVFLKDKVRDIRTKNTNLKFLGGGGVGGGGGVESDFFFLLRIQPNQK